MSEEGRGEPSKGRPSSNEEEPDIPIEITGTNYSISSDPDYYDDLFSWIDEKVLVVGPEADKRALMTLIMERVLFLVSTKLTLESTKTKFYKKALVARKNFRRAVTIKSQEIEEILIESPLEVDKEYLILVNELVHELQRLVIDEMATTLLIRKDMKKEDITGDRLKAAGRLMKSNDLIEEAISWINNGYNEGGAGPDHFIYLDGDNLYDDNHERLVSTIPISERPAAAETPLKKKQAAQKRLIEQFVEELPVSSTSTPKPKDPPVMVEVPVDVPEGKGLKINTEVKPKKNVTILDQPGTSRRDHTTFHTANPVLVEGSSSGDRRNPVRDDGEESFAKRLTEALARSLESVQDVNRGGLNEKLPKFNGDFGAWDGFWEQFQAIVENNPRLGVITKMSRLVQALEGEALNSVKHLRFESSNYEKLKETLQRRFGDKEMVLQEMCRKVQRMDQVSRDDVDGFRRFVDLYVELVEKYLRIYPEAAKAPTSLMTMGYAKLPLEVLEKWEEAEAMKKAASITDIDPEEHLRWFLRWLNIMAESRKRAIYRNPDGKGAQKPKPAGKSSEPKTQARTMNNYYTVGNQKDHHTEKKEKCCFCKGEHRSYNCKGEDLKKNPKKAMTMAIRAKICVNCLKYGHFANKCSENSCPVAGCGKRHHRLLHLAKSPERKQ